MKGCSPGYTGDTSFFVLEFLKNNACNGRYLWYHPPIKTRGTTKQLKTTETNSRKGLANADNYSTIPQTEQTMQPGDKLDNGHIVIEYKDRHVLAMCTGFHTVQRYVVWRIVDGSCENGYYHSEILPAAQTFDQLTRQFREQWRA